MFSKDNEKLESFIGKNSNFTGDISTKGTIRIDGRLTGNVDSDWIVLGENALIKGNVKVTGIVLSGTLEGNIIAKELVDIKRKGRVKGDIVTTKLSVVDGGIIDGTISMNRDVSKVVELSTDKLKEVKS